MNLPNEQKLLKGARKWDLLTFGTIYDLYSPEIYRYAMRLLGDDSLAEECVSETYFRFIKAMQAGQGPKDYLRAYLYRIAHNLITDLYRRQPPPPLELDETLQADTQDLPESTLTEKYEMQKVRLALRTLTPDQRQVINLRFYEGWNNEEVAAALNKSVGAIKALQHRALNMLRRILLKNEEKESRDEIQT